MHTEEEKSQINNRSSHFKNLVKEEQNNPKANKRKEIIKTTKIVHSKTNISYNDIFHVSWEKNIQNEEINVQLNCVKKVFVGTLETQAYKETEKGDPS